ncbi:MAG: DUF2071 domain-containing protein [Bacteroidetes bacterium]|nr:DUF2071 domain-containing protein [Bacteroidota bacterium]MBM3361017.1 DUF2071 domain-containing protein [Betaproteobacteria bacterium]
MKNVFLKANWENLVMVNHEVNPSILIPYLPHGVELDFFNNKTYISLVGFMFTKTHLFGMPIPFFGSFEEINLRFYVKRVDNGRLKKGVVFINETVPFKIVAFLANRLYGEHYTAIPTKSCLDLSDHKIVNYEWNFKGRWNSIRVKTDKKKLSIEPFSFEEYIFERYFGYTKLSSFTTQEYAIHHPQWFTNKLLAASIDCDYGMMYGDAFSCLNNQPTSSIMMAEGSPVSVSWKRVNF